MKKYNILSLLLALFILSCQDSKYDNMVNDKVYFPKSDLQEKVLVVTNSDDWSYPLWIHKGGFIQDKFSGSLEVDYSYLVEYNAIFNTDYEMLNEKYYAFERDFIIGNGENETMIPISFKIGDIIRDLGYTIVYIPISLKSKTLNSEIFDNKSSVLLSVDLRQASLSIDSDWVGNCSVDLNSLSENPEIDITAMLDVEAPEDCEVLYNEDISLLSEGDLLLDRSYYIYDPSLTLKKGNRFVENYIKIHSANVPDGEWVVPVRMISSNRQIAVSDKSWLALKVIKGELDKVIWGGDHLQGNQIILGASEQANLLVGEFEDMELDVTSEYDWISGTTADGKILLSVSPNPSNEERTSILTVRNKSNNLKKSILIKQASLEHGIPLNKELWTIESYSDNCIKASQNIKFMYDGLWRKDQAGKDSFVEFNDRSNPHDPFIITFNLGAEQTFNAIGLMARQEWSLPAPKRVKFEVSNDLESWTAVGNIQNSDGILNAFLNEEVGADSRYNGKTKWFPFKSSVKAQYMRVYLYESWYSTGNVCCLEEIFVSLK